VANHNIEGFSLTHAAILGAGGVEEEFGDLYGIRSGSLELDQDSYDNTGDDGILSTWYWANKANVTIQAGYIPFDTFSLLTSSTVSSSGSGSSEIISAPLWELRQMNSPTRSMLIRSHSKGGAGVSRYIDFILYKVQFQPISFDGPAYKEGLLVNYSGSALFTDTDHEGNPVLDSTTGLPTKAIGKIVSWGEA